MINFISNLIISILNLGIYIFAARIFNSESFGYLSIAKSYFALIVFFGDLNILEIHVKKMAESKYSLNDYYSLYSIIKIVLIPIVGIIFFIIIKSQLNSGLIENNRDQILILLIMGISALLSTFSYVFTGSFQAKMQIVQMQIPLLYGQIVRFLIGCIAIFVFQNFILYVFSNLVCYFIIFVINIYLGRNFKINGFKIKLFKEYLNFGLPILIPRVMNIFVLNLGPILFLKYHNEELLGIYQILATLIIFFTLIDSSAKQILIPTITSLVNSSTENNDKLTQITKQYEKYMLFISTIILIFFTTLGLRFLNFILGPEFVGQGYRFVYFSILFTISWSVWIPYGVILFINEKKWITVLTESIKLGLSLLMWFIFIPSINILALNLGLWISIIPNTIICRYFSYKFYKIGKLNENVIFLIIFLIITLPLCELIKMNHSFSFFIEILWCFLMLCILISLSFLFKILTKDDILFVVDNLNPKKLLHFVQGEIENIKSKKEN